MSQIAIKEFKNLIFSIKSIIVILIFALFSFYIADFLAKTLNATNDNKSAAYSSIRLLVFIFGYLFASILSHNSINKEVELKTARFVVTKVSRLSFLLGKYIGTCLFWFFCLTISYMIISIMSKQFDFEVYIMVLVVMVYFVSLVLMISTLIDKSSLSNFLGLIIGIAFPILGLWVTLNESKPFSFMKYLFPYYFILKGAIYIVIPLIISFIMMALSCIIFKRKEL